jgi:hypothetical protein
MLPFLHRLKLTKNTTPSSPIWLPLITKFIYETSWIKIVHTLMGNFCQQRDDKDNMNALENMGNDAGVILGYHKKAREFTTNVSHFPNWSNPYEMWTNKYRK